MSIICIGDRVSDYHVLVHHSGVPKFANNTAAVGYLWLKTLNLSLIFGLFGIELHLHQYRIR